MQTTLLGLAIAFILALLAALVGPYFIDWNKFRPQFEAEASRIVGAPVRVGGKLDALLLPTPTLRLRAVSVGGDSDAAKVRADKLDVEFNLGALMRGEWRASELSLDGFALDIGLDNKGRLQGAAATGNFNLGSLSIERMNIAGRITLHDASSGATLQMSDLKFSGDVRAQAGAMRGEGSFTLLGARTPFRVSSGQSADGKGTRVRFITDPGERPLLTDLDGVLSFDGGAPKFDGGLTLARPADAKPAAQPWRITSRVKANPASATFEQVEAAYGPDDNALRLTGGGDIRFGATPLLHLALSARQLDADRLLGRSAANAEPVRLLPALRTLVPSLPVLPLPTQIELNADQIALGGRPVQNVAIELRGDNKVWTVNKFEMRAPGATRVSAIGVIASPGPSATFKGPLSIESADPDVLTAWLQGRSDVTYRNQKPLNLRGDMTVAADRIALDGIKTDINGGALEGRLSLSNAADGKSRFEAALTAARFDLDAASSLFAMLTGPQVTWPDEVQISLDAASAVVAGQDVRPAAVSLSYGPKTISLDRLQIGDASKGVGINGAGSFNRVDGSGKLALTAAAPLLSQIGSFIAPFAPAVAERINTMTAPGVARLQLSADAATAQDKVNARAVLDIDAPDVKGSVTLTASPPLAAVQGADLAALKRDAFNVETKLTSDQTASLLTLLGLDKLVSAQDGPAQFESSVAGMWGVPLQVKTKLTGAGVDGDVQGTVDLSSEMPKAALTVAVRRADFAALLDLKPGSVPSLTGAVASRLSIAGNTFTFEDIDSTLGGSRLRGRLKLTRGDETNVDGEIGLDTLDIAPVTALVFGAAGHDTSEPLGRGWLRGWRGRVAFQALSGVLPGGSELRPISGAVAGDGQSLKLENTKAGLGGDEVAVDLDARQSSEGANQGTTFSARVQLSGVDGASLRYRNLAMPGGKVALQMTLAGQGRSASGLAGALSGSGTLTLTDARIAGLDPRAFEVAIRSSDNGQATDDIKLKEIVEPVLAAGSVVVPSAQIPFAIRDGRLRVETATLESGRARIAIAGGYDLLADQADLRAIMSPVTTRPITGRPDIRVDLNGTPDGFTHTVDVAALSSWLAMRAIDRETRRLDQLERGITTPPENDELWEASLPQVDPLPQSQVKIPNRDPRRKAPAAKTASPPRAPAPPVAPPAQAPPPLQPDQPSGSVQVQPLPPPINIKPAPGAVRAPKQRPASSPSSTGTF